MDEDQNLPTPAQNEPVAVADQSVPPADEPQQQPPAPSEPNGDERTADEPADAPADEVTRRPNRAERRIHELNDKLRQAMQTNQPQSQQQLPQFPNYQEGQEVSPQQLKDDVVRTADAIADLRVEQKWAQYEASTKLERDTERLPVQFEELNPNSQTYTPELDAAIAQEYQERAFKIVGYDANNRPIQQLDPSVRLADIAERQVKAARAYAAKYSANIRASVNQTADEQAPRPGGDVPAEVKFEDLSIEEMEKRLGFGQR